MAKGRAQETRKTRRRMTPLEKEAEKYVRERLEERGDGLAITVEVYEFPLGTVYAAGHVHDGDFTMWIDSVDWPKLTPAERRRLVQHEVDHYIPDGRGGVRIRKHDARLGLFCEDVADAPNLPRSIRTSIDIVLRELKRSMGTDSIAEARKRLGLRK